MSAGRRRVLFTRPLESDGPEERLLHELDSAAVVLEVLKFVPGPDRQRLAQALRATPRPEAVAVTSRQASLALSECLREPGAPAAPRCFAVGAATAKPLRGLGVDVECAPGAGAGSLAAHLLALVPRPARVLFLRGDLALDVLPRVLREAGVAVEELEVYRTVATRVNPAPLLSAVGSRLLRASVFRSPSAVQALRQNLEAADWRALMRLPAISPGETTSRALERAGADRVVQAASPGSEDMAVALRGILEAPAGRGGGAEGPG